MLGAPERRLGAGSGMAGRECCRIQIIQFGVPEID
jgi:hypothetical protein